MIYSITFILILEKKMARIALSYSHDIKINIHSNYRIIILMDPEQISKQDSPFLNSFEKF